MACLFRIFRAKIRHSIGNKKYLKEKLQKYEDLVIVAPVFVIPPVVLWFSEKEEVLIPKAEKYLLIGDANIVHKVKHQIIAEHKCTLVERMKSKVKDIDIQILDRDYSYKNSNYDKDLGKRITLLLCLSTATDPNWMEHWPQGESLPTIQSRYMLVETKPGEFNVPKDLISKLLEDPQLAKVFGGSEVRCLPTKCDTIYKNTKIIISDRESIFFLYTLLVFVTYVLLIRRGTMYNLRKKLN